MNQLKYSKILLSITSVKNLGRSRSFNPWLRVKRILIGSIISISVLGVPTSANALVQGGVKSGDICKVEGESVKEFLCFKEGKKLIFRKSVLVAGSSAEPSSLDPIFESNLASVLVMNQMYDRLIRYTSSLAYEGQLAESYTIGEDSLSITFKLKSNSRFHSGRLIAAKDVVYSFDRLRSAESINKGLYSAIESITAIDKQTVLFTLLTPTPNAVLSQLAVAPSYIMDQTVVRSKGNLKRDDGGSGPFKMEKWSSGSEIVLAGNREHFNSKNTKIARLVFKFIPDEISAVSALRAGQINWYNFGDPSAAAQLKNNPDLVYSSNPSLAYLYLSFNTTKAPYNNLDFRTGVSYALNRDEILKLALEGRGAVTGPIVPALKDLAIPNSSYPSYSTSKEKALALIAKGGGTGLSLTLHVNRSSAAQVAAAPVVVSQLGAVGITARIVTVDSTTWFDVLSKQKYDLIFGQSGGAANPDLQFFNSYTCTGSWNYAKICDAAFDDQIDIARAATGAARKLTYQKLQIRVVNLMMPYAFISTMDSLWGWSINVEGYTPLPIVADRRFDGVSIKSK